MTIINDIKIKNPTAELILQKFSKEEISELFSTFLILVSKENIIKKSKIEHKKTKWAEFADKMDGVLDHQTAEHLRKCSQEFRDNFELRDLESK